ncbi:MAG: hypothetical protein ACI8WB_004787 [Phenylobacterium sp.]|jgi:hypothetical protein
MPSTLSAAKGLPLLPVNAGVVLDVVRSADLKEKYKSICIGLQPNHAMLFSMPSSTNITHSVLLQEGNIATVRGISTQGEGAILAFKTTIIRVYAPPFPMIATTIPKKIQLKLIRNEPRFSLDLPARLSYGDMSIEGGVEDISCNGCCFYCDKLTDDLLNQQVEVLLNDPSTKRQYRLAGEIKNIRNTKASDFLGIAFDEESQTTIQQLLQEFILKGSRDV